MTIKNYLQLLGQELHLPAKESEKILKEIRSHLIQNSKDLQNKGFSAPDAEKHACTDFGNPRVVTKGFQKTYSWFFRTTLRVVMLTMIFVILANEMLPLILSAIPSPIVAYWLNVFLFMPWAFFAIVVFLLVRRLTFSNKRLWQLLAITLFTAYFGEIIYDIIRMAHFLMETEPQWIDAQFIFTIFISQTIKMSIMVFIYFCLYCTVSNTPTMKQIAEG